MEPQAASTSAASSSQNGDIRLEIDRQPASASVHQLPSYGEALKASVQPPKENGTELPPAYINTTHLEAGETCPDGLRTTRDTRFPVPKKYTPCQTCCAVIIIVLCFAAVVAINVLLDLWTF